MLVKLAALGTLGYVAYRYVRSASPPRHGKVASLPVAGGPLSENAKLQHSPEPPSEVDFAHL